MVYLSHANTNYHINCRMDQLLYTILYSVSLMYFLLLCSQHSNLLNQARLSILKVRDDNVKDIVEETRTRLEDKDPEKYRVMLEALIVQVIPACWTRPVP